ncbi:hypothetical protein [Nonomuraea dietziae]|uniref:Uncharacterized protein n=1 Tax=Nonomuraea dietziae TaxID=65515 RepID=A0A7W5YUC7_9ACTN|nr:hypothetical protein [Nonomuraea dietziae]
MPRQRPIGLGKRERGTGAAQLTAGGGHRQELPDDSLPVNAAAKTGSVGARIAPISNRYRLEEDVFARAFRARMSEFDAFSALAQRGLRAVGDAPGPRRRLELMRDMYGFMAREFPKLLDRWDQERENRQRP